MLPTYLCGEIGNIRVCAGGHLWWKTPWESYKNCPLIAPNPNRLLSSLKILKILNSHSCQWSLGLIFQSQITHWGAGGSLCDTRVPPVKPLQPNVWCYLRCRSKTRLQAIPFSFPWAWRWKESPQKWTFASVFQKSLFIFRNFSPLGGCWECVPCE